MDQLLKLTQSQIDRMPESLQDRLDDGYVMEKVIQESRFQEAIYFFRKLQALDFWKIEDQEEIQVSYDEEKARENLEKTMESPIFLDLFKKEQKESVSEEEFEKLDEEPTTDRIYNEKLYNLEKETSIRKAGFKATFPIRSKIFRRILQTGPMTAREIMNSVKYPGLHLEDVDYLEHIDFLNERGYLWYNHDDGKFPIPEDMRKKLEQHAKEDKQ